MLDFPFHAMKLLLFLVILYSSTVLAWVSTPPRRFHTLSSTTSNHITLPHQHIVHQHISFEPYKAEKSLQLFANSDKIIDAEFSDGSPVKKDGFLLSTVAVARKFLSNALTAIKENKIFTKDNVAKLGFNVLLSYGWISNTFSITGVIISWILFGKANKISPLAPGQWKGFLLVYAGVWAANNFLRPIRVSLSILAAPMFEKFIRNLQEKFKVSRSVAVAIVVFLFNIVGSFTYLFIGLYIATTITHVPLLHKP